MARVRFDTSGKGRGQVYVDDRPIHGVSGFTFTSHVGEIDRMTLDFPMLDGSKVERDVDIWVMDAVHETLVSLGWTPPPKEP